MIKMISKHYVASPNGFDSLKSMIPSASVSNSRLNAPASVGNVWSLPTLVILLSEDKLVSRTIWSNSWSLSVSVPSSSSMESATVPAS